MNDKPTLVFDFNWKLTLGVVFVFPVLINLSLWQIQRAEEKKTIATKWEAQQASTPVVFDLNTDYSPYQRVFIEGFFLPEKYWLKENQFYNGQLGYNVVVPLKTDEDVIVAVNRGWVRGTAKRDYVPDVETPLGKQTITGTLVIPTDSKLVRESETSAKTWPHKILEIDLKVMGKQSDLSFYPKILRIDPDSPAALLARWKPINMSPAKHYGYAVQWGLLALALIVMYVFASTNLSEWLKSRKS